MKCQIISLPDALLGHIDSRILVLRPLFHNALDLLSVSCPSRSYNLPNTKGSMWIDSDSIRPPHNPRVALLVLGTLTGCVLWRFFIIRKKNHSKTRTVS